MGYHRCLTRKGKQQPKLRSASVPPNRRDGEDDVPNSLPTKGIRDEVTYIVSVRYWRGNYSECETPEEFAQAVKQYFRRAGTSIEITACAEEAHDDH